MVSSYLHAIRKTGHSHCTLDNDIHKDGILALVKFHSEYYPCNPFARCIPSRDREWGSLMVSFMKEVSLS